MPTRTPPASRWAASRADALVASAVLAATAVATMLPPGRPPSPAEAAFAVAACAPLVWRRRRPATVFLTSAIAAEFFIAVNGGHRSVVLLAAPLLALYTVAESHERRRGHLALAAGVAVALAVGHMILKPGSIVGAGFLALVAFGALAVAAGDATRNRRAYVAAVEDRARRAERERDAEAAQRRTEAARRITEDRLRIARELHDALGHQLAVVHVQSAVADRTLDTAPDQARAALAHVRAASRTALAGLRDTIGLLRTAGDPDAPVEPPVGLAELPRLYASFRDHGLRITAGDAAAALPGPVDITAYRVIQESLTNVYRHAGPTDVEVDVAREPGRVRVTVTNAAPDGPVAVPPGAGHGLTGMRERLAALGGTLDAGPLAGGFRVVATIPDSP